MIWCAIISVPLFHRKINYHQLVGMITIAAGLFVKSSVMIPSIFPDYVQEKHCDPQFLNSSTETQENEGVKTVDEASDQVHHLIIGYLCVVLGHFLFSCLFVYEEKFVKMYNKEYQDMSEYKRRFATFRENMKKIQFLRETELGTAM